MATLMALGPGLAGAQSAVRGTVRADSTLHPLPAAEVVIESPEARLGRAGLDGAFLLGRLAAGRHLLVVRAIGFRPLRLTADLNGRDTLDLDVRLKPLPQQLATLSVVGRRPIAGRMEEFARRRAHGFGRFYTRAQLRERETMRLTDFLRATTGIRFVSLPVGCGSGLAIASMRMRAVPPPAAMDCGDHKVAVACYLDLFIDGMPVWQWGQSPPPDIDQFAVRELQAVEIYLGISEMPPEFPRSAGGCGTILMWGRTGDR